MIKVNLLPVRAAKKKETFMNQIYIGILVIIISVLVVGWRAWTMQSKIESLDTQINDRKRELAELRDIEKKVEEFKAKNKVLEDKISAIVALESGRDWFIRIIDHVSMSMGTYDVWVTSLSMGGKGGRRGGGGIYGAPVKIQGGAFEKDAIAFFISNLESNKEYVSRVTLGKITQKKASRATAASYYSYDLTIKIKGAPGAGKSPAPTKKVR
jgi:type IV pilus assembly protein PilN